MVINGFDSNYCKKGFSLNNYCILDITWGDCQFSSKERQHKYEIIRQCEKLFNPKTLRLMCLLQILDCNKCNKILKR